MVERRVTGTSSAAVDAVFCLLKYTPKTFLTVASFDKSAVTFGYFS